MARLVGRLHTGGPRCRSAERVPRQRPERYRERVALAVAASGRRRIIAAWPTTRSLPTGSASCSLLRAGRRPRRQMFGGLVVPDRRAYRGRRLGQRRAADARRAATRPSELLLQATRRAVRDARTGDERLGAGRRGRRSPTTSELQALGRAPASGRARAAAAEAGRRLSRRLTTTDRCASLDRPSRIVNARTTGCSAGRSPTMMYSESG